MSNLHRSLANSCSVVCPIFKKHATIQTFYPVCYLKNFNLVTTHSSCLQSCRFTLLYSIYTVILDLHCYTASMVNRTVYVLYRAIVAGIWFVAWTANTSRLAWLHGSIETAIRGFRQCSRGSRHSCPGSKPFLAFSHIARLVYCSI